MDTIMAVGIILRLEDSFVKVGQCSCGGCIVGRSGRQYELSLITRL